MVKLNKPTSADEVAPAASVHPMRWPFLAAICTAGAMGVATMISLILHLLHLAGREPNFDEHVILQFTWMISQGLMPRIDFLCPYPTAGFLTFAAVLEHLPQTPSLFLGLRFFGLVPLGLFIAAIGLLARVTGRDVRLTTLLCLVLVASGEFPTLWEIRFDLGSWALALAALALLLGQAGTPHVLAATALAVLSLMVSPKHAFVVFGMALGFGLSRWHEGWRPLGRSMAAAAGGAVAMLAALTLFNASIVPDSWHLALMNFRTQQASQYPTTLFEALFALVLRDPVACIPIWLGPVFFALAWRTQSPRTVLTLGGVAMGIGLSMATLPCGYPQYVTLIWAMSTAFLPWLTPSVTEVGPAGRAVFASALAVVALVYAWREIPTWTASPLLLQIRLQEDLATICPPGETAVAAPFTHAWFRATPGYVFIDNDTSYRHAVRKERQRYFTPDYYFERLEQTRPAYVCGFNLADNSPKEYQSATIRYLMKHQTNYVAGSIPYVGHALLKDGRMPVYIRSDLVPRLQAAGGAPTAPAH